MTEKITPLIEGKVRKGGQNPPNTSTERPPPPKGSGGKCTFKNCQKCERERHISLQPMTLDKEDAEDLKRVLNEQRWSRPFWVVQQLEEFPGEDRQADCIALMNEMCQQEGFVCGRIIQPGGRGWWYLGPYNPVWKTQCFFEDCGEENAANLPDGLRRVLLLPCMKNWPWYRRKA